MSVCPEKEELDFGESRGSRIKVELTAQGFNRFFCRDGMDQRSCAMCGCESHSTEKCKTFRTKLCTHFHQGGCKFGNLCSFAHDKSKLRTPPSTWRIGPGT